MEHRPRQVVLATTSFVPDVGGVARYYFEIARRMQISVSVLRFVSAEEEKGDSAYAGIPVQYVLWRTAVPQWLQATAALAREVRARRARHVWVGDILPLGTASWILKRAGVLKAYAVSVHGLDVLTAFARRPKTARRILQEACAVTANSMRVQGEVVRRGIPEGTVRVVYPGVDIPADTPEKEAPHGAWIVLSVCRLVERKRIGDVISAVKILQEKGRQIEYWVVGDGPLRDTWEKQAQAEGIRARFWGAVADDTLAGIYAQAHLFALAPSSDGADIEGFGIVFLEAQAHGIPVVASRAGGVPEAVSDGISGILVPPHDPQAVADALEHMMQEERYVSFQREARAYAGQFSWWSAAEKMEEIFSGNGTGRSS